MNRITMRIGGASLLLATCYFAATSIAPLRASAEPAESASRLNVEQQLAEVKQLMQQGRLIEAESLLEKAESSDVRFPVLHFGDTPAKVRRDLDRLMAAKGDNGQPVADSRSPLSALADRSQKATATEGPGGADVAGMLGGVDNPFRKNASVASGPSHVAVPGQPEPQPTRNQLADAAMLDARQALSVGDVARAEQKIAEVRALNITFDQSHDSPEKLAESISQCKFVAEMRQSSPDAWRRSYAEFLLTQADALLGWNDGQSATRAASEASQLNPRCEVRGLTPEHIFKQVAALKAQSSPTTQVEAAGAPLVDPAQASEQQTPEAGEVQALAEQVAGVGIEETRSATAETLQPATALQPPAPQPPASQSPALGRYGVAPPATLQASVNEAAIQQAQALLPTPGAAGSSPSQPLPLPAADDEATDAEDAKELLLQGEQALRNRDRAGALQLFRTAYEQRDQLDVLSQQRLQGHLQMLSIGSSDDRDEAASQPKTRRQPLFDSTSEDASLLATQLSTEVGKRQSEASRVRDTDPNRALEILSEAQQLVERSQLDDGRKRQLLSRVKLSVRETEDYIREHRSEIDLEAANKAILDEIDRKREVDLQIQQRIAEMVDQFNELIDEHRYAEAEVIASRLYEIAPDDLVAQQVNLQAKMIRRERWSRDIRAESEQGVAENLLGLTQDSADALNDMTRDITFGDDWDQIRNRKSSTEQASRRSAKELEIERKLRMNVMPQYKDAELSEVVQGLSELTGVNIILDPLGLSQEAVRPDTLVNFPKLQNEISLKSALQLILEPLHLTYVVTDEVLKITSEQISDGERKTVVYSVADLVIPIPNFVPSNNVGLQGMINDALNVVGSGPMGGIAGPMSVVHGASPGDVHSPNKTALAQNFGANGVASPVSSGFATPGGPGGLGGAANADFDSLIDLIVSTVEYDSWMENGTGEGEIREFPTNLSLVISQTQRVHEQIADLLEQLRRLQDLQVTIEVRFIRLTDTFFERIGVDFDFNVEDGTGIPNAINSPLGTPEQLIPGASFEPRRSSATVGLNQETSAADFPNYTVNLDLPFRQGSFGLAQPQFGNFNATAGATFGFAILSDLEAYFFINAAQGDARSNVLQAPKVTLFNGQQATVIDAAQVPFVISVVPVVGEFAAAQQPVIVVLSEGTMMTVQAVVSDDRRYVRLTLVPFFSEIGNVSEFTFEGSETTSASMSSSTDEDDDGVISDSSDDAMTTVRSGTTVQLPTFQIISVSTTVSVPDGGTVLLGGIKRMREGRNEFGVPLLSKIPYVDRLFRNVGIGRSSDSLMMMVTPHIIIQEEEEERLIGGQ